ncbi:DUF977 family protein, partial [Escherichia coli]|uniref:DUF977 family protein n=2 Tax=Escherichia coli TaxID=562 RepID=UPI001F2A7E16
QKKLIMLPSETMIWQPEFTDKTLSRKIGAVQAVVDPDLIWSLPDGEIRRYDRRLNIICRECRNSEVMQLVLAFYQGVGSGGGAVSEISYQASISAGIRIKGEEHGNKTRR